MTGLSRHMITDPVLCMWYIIGRLSLPLLKYHSFCRLKQGKDTTEHLPERFGRPTLSRPSSSQPLLWFHAASVGETLSIFPVIGQLLKEQAQLNILVTTTTSTGGKILRRHPIYGQRLFHQLCPYDAPHIVARFLKYWRPRSLILVESELWPGLIGMTHLKGIPIMLLNARLSARSAQRWKAAPCLLRYLMRSICWVTPRSIEDADRLSRFGITSLPPIDLKEAAAPLPYRLDEAAYLKEKIGPRPIFVAASTHPGEEELIAEASRKARELQPSLLTIIIPRHPERGPHVARALHAPRRSSGEIPASDDAYWIVDTLGETGLFFALAERVFIGNSLCAPGGGHNPLEPLRFQRPTALGPYMQNWHDACHKYKASLHIIDTPGLLAEWLNKPVPLPPLPEQNEAISAQLTQRIIETCLL